MFTLQDWLSYTCFILKFNIKPLYDILMNIKAVIIWVKFLGKKTRVSRFTTKCRLEVIDIRSSLKKMKDTRSVI